LGFWGSRVFETIEQPRNDSPQARGLSFFSRSFSFSCSNQRSTARNRYEIDFQISSRRSLVRARRTQRSGPLAESSSKLARKAQLPQWRYFFIGSLSSSRCLSVQYCTVLCGSELIVLVGTVMYCLLLWSSGRVGSAQSWHFLHWVLQTSTQLFKDVSLSGLRYAFS